MKQVIPLLLVLACAMEPLAPRHAEQPLIAAQRGPEPPKFERGNRGKPLLAIVIDDLGDSVPQAAAFADVLLPLTFSVLPHRPAATEVATYLGKKGREYLVHIPMEPESGEEVGGASFLTTTMSVGEIEGRLECFLERVPGAVGANNHMGSRFTRDREGMRVVLSFLHTRGLFFLDSRTTSATVGREVAKMVGIPFAERDVFLDHNAAEVENRLREAVQIALRKGVAVAIGHPIQETLEALIRLASKPDLEVDVVPLSVIVQEAARMRGGNPVTR